MAPSKAGKPSHQSIVDSARFYTSLFSAANEEDDSSELSEADPDAPDDMTDDEDDKWDLPLRKKDNQYSAELARRKVKEEGLPLPCANCASVKECCRLNTDCLHMDLFKQN
ncbi:hypothetical protein AAP_03453 [Ascosphaera apis ARSEF 7405]|uniref:Uncharacterized protein n=1 Tax=Ascosphaera apis ARSEF 7405 TaxID=392613 RepID=A0A162IBY6_9EURO|nr:hypothetical protein AAP_03453 [Ascosphaera apis ARSEF 7405]